METVTGAELMLPFVDELGSTRSHLARRVPWHAHAGVQILYLQRGTTAYEFAAPRPGTVVLTGGHLLVIPGGLAHRGAPDIRPPCSLLHLVFAKRHGTAGTPSPFTPPEFTWLKRQFSRHPLEPRPFSRRICRLLEELSRSLSTRPVARRQAPPGQARLRLQLCELLIESAAQLEAAPPPEQDELIAAAEAWFRSHLGEKIRMTALSRALGVPRARLFDQFKRSAGLTPNDFLLRLRVAQARELMADPQRSLTRIALETGFSSSQYFSTVFRRYTGRTPTAYRAGLLAGSG